MVDELPPSEHSANSLSAGSSSAPLFLLPYAGLRWIIRITGVLLMFGGVICLGSVAGKLLFGSLAYHKVSDSLSVVIVSLIALGLGIFVFRIGLRMLCSVDGRAVRNFSFIFALVYTLILMQILPAGTIFDSYPILRFLLFLFSLGLAYFILKRILLTLLFPRGES